MNLALALKTYDNLQVLKGKISQLKVLSSGLVLDGFSKDEYLQKSLGDFYPIIAEIFTSNPEFTLTKQIQLLQEELENLKILNVVLAFVPSQSFVIRVLEWLHSNVSSNVILKISFNPEIIGGCVLSFEGRYLDLSSKKKLLNLFDQKHLFS